MKQLIERLLERLFPPAFTIHRTDRIAGEDLKVWMYYEAPNHTKHDPFRPMGPYDSWAGHLKQKT